MCLWSIFISGFCLRAAFPCFGVGLSLAGGSEEKTPFFSRVSKLQCTKQEVSDEASQILESPVPEVRLLPGSGHGCPVWAGFPPPGSGAPSARQTELRGANLPAMGAGLHAKC